MRAVLVTGADQAGWQDKDRDYTARLTLRGWAWDTAIQHSSAICSLRASRPIRCLANPFST
nr:hypothetical protein [Mesorhizobium caraganae]